MTEADRNRLLVIQNKLMVALFRTISLVMSKTPPLAEQVHALSDEIDAIEARANDSDTPAPTAPYGSIEAALLGGCHIFQSLPGKWHCGIDDDLGTADTPWGAVRDLNKHLAESTTEGDPV